MTLSMLFHYTFTVSCQAKRTQLVLGRQCHSRCPISPALRWAFPDLLCYVGCAERSRAVCWLLTCFTMENSSTSITYRKRMNVSFEWSGRTGRKWVIL